VTVADLRSWNRLRSSRAVLSIGQELVILPSSGKPAKKKAAAARKRAGPGR